MKRLQNNKGFSLIELMIVVAIIGILSAIAIPNFQKFQLKSRQSEAKSQLAAIFQAEKAFQQEWSQYFGDLVDIGYEPEGTMRYVLWSQSSGINAPNETSYKGTVAAGGAANIIDTNAFCAASANCSLDTTMANAGAANQSGALNAVAFQASAIGNIDKTDATNDEWTIDQAKTLTHVTNDVVE